MKNLRFDIRILYISLSGFSRSPPKSISANPIWSTPVRTRAPEPWVSNPPSPSLPPSDPPPPTSPTILHRRTPHRRSVIVPRHLRHLQHRADDAAQALPSDEPRRDGIAVHAEGHGVVPAPEKRDRAAEGHGGRVGGGVEDEGDADGVHVRHPDVLVDGDEAVLHDGDQHGEDAERDARVPGRGRDRQRGARDRDGDGAPRAHVRGGEAAEARDGEVVDARVGGREEDVHAHGHWVRLGEGGP